MESMIQATFENHEGERVGTMLFPCGAIPQIGDRITYFDNKNVIRQREVVRGRHFVQSIHAPGVTVKLFVMSESEVLTEASQAEPA